MRKIQIIDNLHCVFVEYVNPESFDESKQIEISDEDRLAIGVTKQFNVANKTIIPYDNSHDILVRQNQLRIYDLKKKLADTDYKVIKYTEGELTEEEYTPVRDQRKVWRAEINKLEKTL